MKTSIIIPTYCRPEQLRRNVIQLLDTLVGYEAEVIVVAEVVPESIESVKDLAVRTAFHEDWRGSVANWNIGAAMATGDLLVTGADDLWFTDGWLREALRQMAIAQTCYCGLNDLMWNGWDHDPTHWIITRAGIVEYCGGCLMPPCYKTTFPDNEVAARIRRADQYTWCRQAIVDHQHFGNGKAPVDKSYLTMSRHFHEDQAVYLARQAAGFPDDFQAVVLP
jgi:glycosyltransferase involved in cell wall biosynthesis